MTIAESKQRPRFAVVPTPDVQTRVASVRRRVSGAVTTARTNVTPLIEHVPGTVQATRGAAHGMTVALQSLPDSTLRTLAAGSVGLGAGLYLAGAPRLVVAAGFTPALAIAAAIALRPIEPEAASQPRRAPHRRTTDMTDEHTKGTLSTAQGKLEAALGRVTGDKEEQAHGKAKQIQGHAQKVLGDVQDAIRESKDKP
jgi:uncharacterized protein YjbJ (UPF0337 family)